MIKLELSTKRICFINNDIKYEILRSIKRDLGEL